MSQSQLRFFKTIPVIPDRGMILARLGYKKRTTALNPSDQQMLDGAVRLGLALCRPAGGFGRYRIREKTPDYISLENRQVLESKDLSRFLRDSEEIVFMVSTVGEEVVDRIFHEVSAGNAALGVILDAVASQTADAGLDWLMEFINKALRPEGKKLTGRRFSPGYGDLPLPYQKVIFDLLDLSRLNLKLNEEYMLIPEKSVLAVAGVEGMGAI